MKSVCGETSMSGLLHDETTDGAVRYRSSGALQDNGKHAIHRLVSKWTHDSHSEKVCIIL